MTPIITGQVSMRNNPEKISILPIWIWKGFWWGDIALHQLTHTVSNARSRKIELAGLQMINQQIFTAPQASFGCSKHPQYIGFFLHHSGIHDSLNLIEAAIHVHSLSVLLTLGNVHPSILTVRKGGLCWWCCRRRLSPSRSSRASSHLGRWHEQGKIRLCQRLVL